MLWWLATSLLVVAAVWSALSPPIVAVALLAVLTAALGTWLTPRKTE
jgi:hypothetical protein